MLELAGVKKSGNEPVEGFLGIPARFATLQEWGASFSPQQGGKFLLRLPIEWSDAEQTALPVLEGALNELAAQIKANMEINNDNVAVISEAEKQSILKLMIAYGAKSPLNIRDEFEKLLGAERGS
eukprot:2728798-Rhodomonas_salina.1